MSSDSVLIVDDNPVDVMLVSKMIKRSGFFGAVHTASNGEEALAMYHEHNDAITINNFPPRLVLLDINMPLINGFEFLEIFGKMPQPKTPHSIVMLTSSNADNDRERAQENPLVFTLLVKPFRVQDAINLAQHCGLAEPDNNAQAV